MCRPWSTCLGPPTCLISPQTSTRPPSVPMPRRVSLPPPTCSVRVPAAGRWQTIRPRSRALTPRRTYGPGYRRSCSSTAAWTRWSHRARLSCCTALRARGVESTRYVLTGGGHGDLGFLGDTESGLPWTTRETMDLIIDFLGRTLRQQAQG